MNKKKIINDPVHGFISLPGELIFDIIEHPWFQRLRRIRQLGLTDFVYPGALHTRFHHALGAMHLMKQALEHLKHKEVPISEQEHEACLLAILLHDIGHGPFSHALENSLLQGVNHEQLSLALMEQMNLQFDNKLQLAIKIFTNQYERKFFHDLVSSQLDMDRIDYLCRDSFFTGVSEGTISADRIVKMLNVVDDGIVVEEKGIYSIENFLNARRLMYWQVYLHKTCLSAEHMLINIVRRARQLSSAGQPLYITGPLAEMLALNNEAQQLWTSPSLLELFCKLDDIDIWSAVKRWSTHYDYVLKTLSQSLIDRKLLGIHLSNEPIAKDLLEETLTKTSQHFKITKKQAQYFVVHGGVSNAAYISSGSGINILTKSGVVKDIAEASDLPNINAMRRIVKKYYLCFPKAVSLQNLHTPL